MKLRHAAALAAAGFLLGVMIDEFIADFHV
jgi:hypothetical protein